jgi:hypothetical protein
MKTTDIINTGACMSKSAVISLNNENQQGPSSDLSNPVEIKIIQEEMESIITNDTSDKVGDSNQQYELEKLNLLSKLDSLGELEKLNLLSKLDSLGELEKLNLLSKLDSLGELEKLNLLSKLENLGLLSSLEDLQHLKKLEQLVQLAQLNKLEELKKLEKLDSLSSLDKLDELSKLDKLQKLSHLDQLKELNQLIELNKLQELGHLKNLTSLKELVHLDKISELSKLDVIGKLEHTLSHHKEALAPLNKLEHLNKLEQLDNLMMMEKLTELKKLSELDKLVLLKKLDELQNLSSLSELDNLKSLRRLDEMQNLDQLKKLSELQNLGKLDELKNLNNLEKLGKLEKLDRIDDARFAERLERLDKLDILKTESKKLVFQQFVGFILDVFKFVLAGFCILMVMTTERGQQISSKILPAIGFGNAAQTNLALQMLVSEIPEEDFDDIIQQTRKKMEYEINQIFSLDAIVGFNRRSELIKQVKGYSFSANGVDLGHEAEIKIKEKKQLLEVEAVESIDYAISLAKSQSNSEKEKYLREIKILLMNRKYIELLDKTLPFWSQGQEMVRASLVAILELESEAPEILDKILSKPVINNRP